MKHLDKHNEHYCLHVLHHGGGEGRDGLVKLNLFSFVMIMGVISDGDEYFDMFCPITGIIKSLGVVTFFITGVIASHSKIFICKNNHEHDALVSSHSRVVHGRDHA